MPEVALWLVDYIPQLVTILLIMLRGAIPDLISIVSTNALIFGGTIVLYIGLSRYVGVKKADRFTIMRPRLSSR